MTEKALKFSETIPLSSLNHHAYCPRRCYLIHAEGEFPENLHTLRGRREHERVDRSGHETGAGVRVEFGLPVWSDRLGLSGRCDVVEFWADGTVFPVEYKHGKRRRWINDDLQLTAQALCLEEMLGISVVSGAIFHQGSRRRREVEFTTALRREVEAHAEAVHHLLAQERRPPPVEEAQRCPECSLLEICQPELSRSSTHWRRLHAQLFVPEPVE